MPTGPLTKKQEVIYAFLIGYYSNNAYMPTRQEIADRFKYSPAAVQHFLQAMEKKGYLKLIPGKYRGIQIHELKVGTD